MDYQDIAFPDVVQGSLQLWPFRIVPTGLVCKHLVQLLPLQLPVSVLVYAANPDVSHSLVLAGVMVVSSMSI
jgi:hypothetical protein